jgi:uroporphyrinogen-III synthase
MMAAAPLSGRSVVVTRPEEPDDALAGRLREAGAQVRVRPLVRLTAAADPQPLQQALAALPRFDWIVFTSANAVRACVQAAPPQTAWPRCACVGSATAAAAEAAGIPVALVPERFSAEGLADAWPPEQVRGARILWPHADAARATLAERLRAAGAEVVPVVAYQTREDLRAAEQLRAELATTPADVVLFTSPSAVRAFAAAGATPVNLVIGVIGTVTAAAAAAAGVPVHVQPAHHTLEALVAALAAYFASGAAAPLPENG